MLRTTPMENKTMLKTNIPSNQERLISDVQNGEQLLIANKGCSASNLMEYFDVFVIHNHPGTKYVKKHVTLERVTDTVADMCHGVYDSEREALAFGTGGDEASLIMEAVFFHCGVRPRPDYLSI